MNTEGQSLELVSTRVDEDQEEIVLQGGQRSWGLIITAWDHSPVLIWGRAHEGTVYTSQVRGGILFVTRSTLNEGAGCRRGPICKQNVLTLVPAESVCRKCTPEQKSHSRKCPWEQLGDGRGRKSLSPREAPSQSLCTCRWYKLLYRQVLSAPCSPPCLPTGGFVWAHTN